MFLHLDRFGGGFVSVVVVIVTVVVVVTSVHGRHNGVDERLDDSFFTSGAFVFGNLDPSVDADGDVEIFHVMPPSMRDEENVSGLENDFYTIAEAGVGERGRNIKQHVFQQQRFWAAGP